MIRYRRTTYDRRFTTITLNVDDLDAMIAKDGLQFHIGSEGSTDDCLPWQLQAIHRSRYLERLSDLTVDGVAKLPVVRLSDPEERADGLAPITVVDGWETLAAFKDAGLENIWVEVLKREADEIEARLI